MTRLYDMNPQIIKCITDELNVGKAEKDWIKKFLDDDKIKLTIKKNEEFYKKVYEDPSYILSDISEETHQQVHEGIAEIIVAWCIHKSSFDATHEFCTGEGKNKKDRVDFKLVGNESTYLVEIRSTRESERSQKINNIYHLKDLSDKAIQETINPQNICVDEDHYQNARRLQLQILEKCTKNEKGKLYTHKFPTKDETKAKHIIFCMPFGREDINEGVLNDVLYRDYNHLDKLSQMKNACGIFNHKRTDDASKILQERIDCVVFLNYNLHMDISSLNYASNQTAHTESTIFEEIFKTHRFEAYLGYNPRYYSDEESMKEFETMLATFLGSVARVVE